jgi:ubiquinol-cytochrome c reductase cytochrome b subunit
MRAFLPSAFFCAATCCAVLGFTLTQPLQPVSAGSSAKQRGAELFATHGCAHCHGTAGVGGGKGPDLQLVRKRMSKEQITLQIRNGGLEMPAFGSSLTDPQIQDLVAYLRAKRKFVKVAAAPHAATATSTPSDTDPN